MHLKNNWLSYRNDEPQSLATGVDVAQVKVQSLPLKAKKPRNSEAPCIPNWANQITCSAFMMGSLQTLKNPTPL
jgi:hypothetical protein